MNVLPQLKSMGLREEKKKELEYFHFPLQRKQPLNLSYIMPLSLVACVPGDPDPPLQFFFPSLPLPGKTQQHGSQPKSASFLKFSP